MAKVYIKTAQIEAYANRENARFPGEDLLEEFDLNCSDDDLRTQGWVWFCQDEMGDKIATLDESEVCHWADERGPVSIQIVLIEDR